MVMSKIALKSSLRSIDGRRAMSEERDGGREDRQRERERERDGGGEGE